MNDTLKRLRDIAEQRGGLSDKDVGFGHGTFRVVASKADGDDRWLIDGYASTKDLDEQDDIVLPSAFQKTLPRFMEFPNLHFNHQVRDEVIGSIRQAAIDDRGLKVVGEISKAESRKWTKIQEGHLKAFSFMFAIAPGGAVFDEDSGIRTITDLDLIEISVVNKPANRAAQFEIMKSVFGDLQAEGLYNSAHFKQGKVMDPKTVDGTTVKNMIDESLKQQREAIVSEAKSAVDDKITTTVTTALGKHKDSLDDMRKDVKEIQDFVQNHSGTEVKEKLDQFSGKIAALEELANDIRKARQLPFESGVMIHEVKSDESAEDWEVEAASELKMDLTPARLLLNHPKSLASGEGLQEALTEFQKEAMNVYILDSIMFGSRGYKGVKSLKRWKRYQKYAEIVAKAAAMDTADTSSWVPTGFTGEINRRIETEALVAGLFRSFTMPTKTYDWPILGARPTGYRVAESTDDTGTSATVSVTADAKATFSAEKLGVRIFTSVELVEDAIVAILSILQDDIVTTLRRAIDYAIINGDADGTHQDTDIDTAGSTHVGWAWDGLRKKGLAGTTVDAGANILTAAYLRSARKSMGIRGTDASRCAIILNVEDYIDLLSDTNVATVDKFGSAATWLTGFLTALDGMPIVVSDQSRTDLDETGINGADENTHGTALVVNRDSWMMGDRRMITLKSDEIIRTDQIELVGTVRKDFQETDTTSGGASVGIVIEVGP